MTKTWFYFKQTTQDDKMNILVQLFWICLAVFESDYEHEFLLALRLLEKVLNKLPLDRPGQFNFDKKAPRWTYRFF